MSTTEKRIKYLEGLLPKDKRIELEEKHWDSFSKYSTYRGNGVYSWFGILSTNTRELYLMGILQKEKIPYEEI